MTFWPDNPQFPLQVQIFDDLTSAIVVINSQGKLWFINNEAENLLQLTTTEIQERNLSDWKLTLLNDHEESFSNFYAEFQKISEKQKLRSFPMVGLRNENTEKTVWTKLNIAPHFSSDGTLQYVLFSFTDLSDLRDQQNQLALHAEIFSTAGEAVAITDPSFHIVDVNKAYCYVTQYTHDQLIGQKLELLSMIQKDLKIYNDMKTQLTNQGFWQGEVWNRRLDGERFPILLTVSKIERKAGKLTHYAVVFSDITELKLARERLDFLAYHDQLTYLPNRSMSQLRFQHSVQRAGRVEGKVALLYIDLDDFKAINDSLGHSKGDYLLKQVSARLQKVTRKQDTVARLGGDEFLIILEEIDTTDHIAAVARKILSTLDLPFSLGEYERFIGASIGISVFPEDGSSFDILLKHADAAMFSAKAKGRNSYQFYRSEISDKVNRRSQIEYDLRNSLKKDSFQLFYQPQINIKNGTLIGAEALLRWNHPTEEFISPAEFIPIMENTGMIVSIGRWVAVEAMTQLKLWRAAGIDLPRIAINVSAIQLQKDHFLQFLLDNLNQLNLTPNDLEIEITESVFVDSDLIPKVIDEMHQQGFYLALDDFGTGYSSLSYLTRLPFNKIKLDRSFVSHIPQDRSSEAMARSLVALAKTLGFEVIAEGVENNAQLEFLNLHGCDEAQGFFIGKPVPAKDFIPLIQSISETIGLNQRQAR